MTRELSAAVAERDVRPLSPAIERFLQEFEASRGFGLTWRFHPVQEGALVAPLGADWCCPISAPAGESRMWYPRCVPSYMSRAEAERIAVAADYDRDMQDTVAEPEIRARLLAAVGLA